MSKYNGEYEKVTVTGFACKKCHRFWGDDEHMASFCCATNSSCDKCGAETEKSYGLCRSCREKADLERFLALQEVEWDGTTPICERDSGRYCFDADDLYCILDETDDPLKELDNLEFHLCEAMEKPTLDINQLIENGEYITDDGIEDLNATSAEIEAIEKTVNEFLDGALQQLWTPTNKRIRLSPEMYEDMKKRIQDAIRASEEFNKE